MKIQYFNDSGLQAGINNDLVLHFQHNNSEAYNEIKASGLIMASRGGVGKEAFTLCQSNALKWRLIPSHFVPPPYINGARCPPSTR